MAEKITFQDIGKKMKEQKNLTKKKGGVENIYLQYGIDRDSIARGLRDQMDMDVEETALFFFGLIMGVGIQRDKK